MEFIKRNNVESSDISTITDLFKGYEESVFTCYKKSGSKQADCLKLLVPNAIFIIEYLTRSCYPEFREREEYEPSIQLSKIWIDHDLLLLENQIPYFFLQLIFNHFYPSSSPLRLKDGSTLTFNELVKSFFQKYNINGVDPNSNSVMHFTDLIRTFHKPKNNDHRRNTNLEFTASATELDASGVVFKKVSGSCLLDVDFNNNILELPRFELNEDQESLYRNLMALELCHYPGDTFIIDYFVFMGTLINSADDISLLVKAGVLVNRVGNYHDAANTFNKFCAGITNYEVGESYLVPVYEKLNAYYKKRRHIWCTTLKREYFGTPFRALSTVTAVSMLVFNIITAVYTVVQKVREIVKNKKEEKKEVKEED